jgi:hypothetical protein
MHLNMLSCLEPLPIQGSIFLDSPKGSCVNKFLSIFYCICSVTAEVQIYVDLFAVDFLVNKFKGRR